MHRCGKTQTTVVMDSGPGGGGGGGRGGGGGGGGGSPSTVLASPSPQPSPASGRGGAPRYGETPVSLSSTHLRILIVQSSLHVIPGRAEREPGIHTHCGCCECAALHRCGKTQTTVVMDSGPARRWRASRNDAG
ncbi:hypothetical protein D4Q71_13240 [Rhodopseudomonas palustris]|nr:hypothetical protein D4Q71_13240 [Rhodopseudomonas palustris]